MANQVIINGTLSIVVGNVRDVGTLATTINMSGSSYVSTATDITASAYQALDTASLANVKGGYFSNNDISASIVVALDSSGTSKIIVLGPETETTWAYSGSVAAVPLWAKAISPANNQTAELQYFLFES